MDTLEKIKKVLGKPAKTISAHNGKSLVWHTKKEIIILLVYRKEVKNEIPRSRSKN